MPAGEVISKKVMYPANSTPIPDIIPIVFIINFGSYSTLFVINTNEKLNNNKYNPNP